MARPRISDTNTTPGLVSLGSFPSKAPVSVFNGQALDNLIKTKGFEAFHFKSAPSPDRYQMDAPVDPSTQAAYQGRIYYDVRPLKNVPQNFQINDRLNVQGIYGVHSVIFNVSGTYEDDREETIVQIKVNDLIMFNETITVPSEQLFEYNPTGPNRLWFKVLGVDYLADNEIIYEEHTDFSIIDGEIYWLPGGTKPHFANGKGAVLTCVYYSNPVYVVTSLPHGVRIIPSNAAGNAAFPREAFYAPQLVVASKLTYMQPNNILDWKSLPPLPEYPASRNTTGGSF